MPAWLQKLRNLRIFRKPATYGVIIFVILFLWGLSREAAATEVDVVIGLGGGTTHESTVRVQEVLVEFDRNWSVGVLRLGNEPRIEDTWAGLAVYRVDWREEKRVAPFAQFGVAYFEHAPAAFVSEQLTYNLTLGVRFFDVFDLGWMHFSTAGRAYQNRGLDYVGIRAVIPLH